MRAELAAHWAARGAVERGRTPPALNAVLPWSFSASASCRAYSVRKGSTSVPCAASMLTSGYLEWTLVTGEGLGAGRGARLHVFRLRSVGVALRERCTRLAGAPINRARFPNLHCDLFQSNSTCTYRSPTWHKARPR